MRTGRVEPTVLVGVVSSAPLFRAVTALLQSPALLGWVLFRAAGLLQFPGTYWLRARLMDIKG